MSALNQRAMEAFRAFVECGTVAKASDRLLRTPPQVSRLLSMLEDEVGFPLLIRNGRGLLLTPEGKEFYAQMEAVLVAQDQLARHADQIRRGRRERISVLSAPFVSHALINNALAKMMKRHPGLVGRVESQVRLDIDNWIGNTAFDIVITVLPVQAGAFEIEPFLEVEAIVAMHPDHPLAKLDIVTFDELVNHDLIITHARSVLGQHLETLAKQAGKRLNVRVEARNGLIASQLAGENIGCCLADPFVALSCGARELVLRPFSPGYTIRYGFLFPSWKGRTPIVNDLADEIRSAAQGSLAHIQEYVKEGRKLKGAEPFSSL